MVQWFILWWKWHFGTQAERTIALLEADNTTIRNRLDKLDTWLHTFAPRMSDGISAAASSVESLQEQITVLGQKIDFDRAGLQKQLDQLRANVAAHDEERKQVIRAETWHQFQTLTNEESLENVPAR
jgi:hypothetical protein